MTSKKGTGNCNDSSRSLRDDNQRGKCDSNGWCLGSRVGAAGVAVDGALFVAGGTVLFLLGDGFQVGSVVFGGHLDFAVPEAGEGWVIVEDVSALGVDVEEVESCLRGAAALGESGFNALEKGFEDRSFEGVEEEGEGRGAGKVEVEGVLLIEADGGDGVGGGVRGVGGEPEVEVSLGYVGHGGVELDADDLVEGEFAGEEHGSAFAGTDVDEGVAGDGMGGGGAPAVDEGAEDAGGDGVVGGDVLVVGVAGDEMASGNEATGVGVVDLVEGMDGMGGRAE